MRIVVNHITRMSVPPICVAGINADTLGHVRPTTPSTDPITRRLLRHEGGAFRIGAVVDLGSVRSEPSPPETEDHRFETARVRHVTDLQHDEFLALLDGVSSDTLEEGFGPELERVGWKYAVEAGQGLRSLAVIKARRRLSLEIDSRYGRLQVRLNDVQPPTYLPVTDVRFFEPDHTTVRRDVVDDVAHRLRSGVNVFLMLGLARPFQASGDDRDRHWLQLNGLVLADRPVGDVP